MVSPQTNAAKRIRNVNAIFGSEVMDGSTQSPYTTNKQIVAEEIINSEDSNRKHGRQYMEINMRSETPNKKARMTKLLPPPQELNEEDEFGDLRLTQENLAAYQSIYKAHDPMSKFQMQKLNEEEKKKLLIASQTSPKFESRFETKGSFSKFDSNYFLKDITSVKSFAFDNQSPDTKLVGRRGMETQSQVGVKSRMAQSMVWDLSNSTVLKQSLMSAQTNSNMVELQRVPVLTYCFDKYRSTRKI